jgi:hypothetical protein
VRRLSVASLDSGAESPVYGEEPSASADRDPGGKPPWANGAGRRAAWPVRVAPWPATRSGERPSDGNGAGNDTAGITASGFPVLLGEAFSMRFWRVHHNDSPGTAARRGAFIQKNVRDKDPRFDCNGSGTSVTQSTGVARTDVRSADTTAVTLPAGVNGQPTELGVPRCASDGRPAVPSQPAWLPAPPVAALPRAWRTNHGQTAKSALASRLPGFCQASVGGGQAALGRPVAPAASIGGPGGAVSFDGIASPQGSRGGATRDITVTVDWTVPGQVGTGAPRLVTTYDMSVIDRQTPKMVCKGHPCIYAADGNPMTRFASPWAVPRGPRSPRELTDVHGREG